MSVKPPPGFAIVSATGRNKTGLYANLGRKLITLSGSEVPTLSRRATFAARDSQFAMYSDDDAELSLTPMGKCKICTVKGLNHLPRGKYRGERQGEWWVFSRIAEDDDTARSQ